MSKKKPTFEEALHELEKLAGEIEEGKIGLEESITKYEEGMKLVRYCREILSKAELKIQSIQKLADGTATTGPFERGEAPASEAGE